jgi:chromosome segregation ATPase
MADEPTVSMLVTAKEKAKIENARRPAEERMAEAKAAMAKMQEDRLAKMTKEEREAENARLEEQKKEQERIAKLSPEERHIEMLKARKTRLEAELAQLTSEIAKLNDKPVKDKPVR